MRFNHDFIGYSQTETVLKFHSGDDKVRFNLNLKSQPDDWYYRFNEVTYDINRYGHRSKNVGDIDLDNYILFTGCSHTEGMGLELEKTFPYLAANDLGIDYYNLALGGSGIDVMTHNLMMWIHTVKKLPKALIIMWPQTARFVHLDQKDSEHLTLEVPTCTTTPTSERFMVMGEQIRFFDAVRKMSSKVINTAYPCQIVNLKSDILGGGDKARDLGHAGILSNRKVADSLVQQLS